MKTEDLKKYILFGTLKLKDKKKVYVCENCVFSIDDTHYKNQQIIEIINYKKVGTKNNVKGLTEVKGSYETRNKITGAYE